MISLQLCYRPVIIRDIVPQWKAYKYWNKEFFLQKYSKEKVLFKSVYVSLFLSESIT